MTEGVLYFRDGKLVDREGDIKIYELNGYLHLESSPGHNLWTVEYELDAYKDQIAGKPFGNCLEIGLGLGVASKYILSHEKVSYLHTVEANKNVIILYDRMNIRDKRHCISNCTGIYFLYTTKEQFDFIFLDFYREIDEESLPLIQEYAKVAKQKVLKKNGIIMGWFDIDTPDEFVDEFYKAFD